ncbi:MAG: M4 family metallopeptidase [Saprospiraceae bacterium]|nr:M4 family metallopeptidase [Saprospiraceae bacterium]
MGILLRLFILLIGITATAHAQFKTIPFGTVPQGYRSSVKIQPPAWQISKGSVSEQQKVAFRPIATAKLTEAETGLIAGFLTDRKVPAYIQGTGTAEVAKGQPAGVLAARYLSEAASLMRIQTPEEEWKMSETVTDELGMVHVKFSQAYRNIPIYGAEVIVHGRGDQMEFVNGHYFPSTDRVEGEVVFSAAHAVGLVEEDLGERPDYKNDIGHAGSMETTNRLVYLWKEGVLIPAYHITTYKNLIERWEYFIHATKGSVLKKFQSICKFHHNHEHGKQCTHAEVPEDILDGKATANAQDLFNINRLINTYEVSGKFFMIDGSRDMFSSVPSELPNDPNGVIWTIDAFNSSPVKDDFRYDHVTSSNNIWSNKTAVSSHYNGGKAFEYFRNIHNRKSINGNGGNIISLINVADEDGSSLGNAFWNGQAMFYGNGDGAFLPLARGLDVAGHEMTHGVVQNTANLEYEGESGALNESFADIFGAMIDRDDWKIGEDVVKVASFPSGALRNMEDPHNGAATNDFNNGWQPRHYNERFKGTQDNGGVHINSGIPNFAFFKFATAVGKDKAEKVYYRALSLYLTKSSQFVDCRVAVVKAAGDLFGATEVNAARKAFDEVGIVGETGGDYEDDVSMNPGTEFLLTTGPSNVGLFLLDKDGKELAKLSPKSILSKPSITDDGTVIVYVASDKKLYYTTIDWAQAKFTADQSLDNNPVWRNIVISKDGGRIAALFDDQTPQILVYDFESNTEQDFELYNPTFSTGVSTGDVLYADAMEFDISGEYVMYDAENQISSNTAGDITYWDISFLQVWDNELDDFGSGRVEKLFTSLPEDVSVGNPSFSKNSPYIICFDYLDEEGNVSILGANIERGDVGLLFENNTLGYPNYSSKDNRIAFDNEGTNGLNVGVLNLSTSKIMPSGSPVLLTSSKRWAVWFSNGSRNLSALNSFSGSNEENYTIIGNPAGSILKVRKNRANVFRGTISIYTIDGKKAMETGLLNQSEDTFEVDISALIPGNYWFSIAENEAIHFIKR